MENKFKSSTIVTVLLVLIVLGLVGYICYDKGVFGKKDNTKENEVLEKEQDYDLATAEELINRYYFNRGTSNLFSSELTDDDKKYIAIKNLAEDKTQAVACEELNGFVRDESGYCEYANDNKIKTNGGVILYDVLNSEYKFLFGKNSEVEKQDFESSLNIWKYDSSQNAFIVSYIVGGVVGGPHFSTYGVQSAKVSGETLTINVGYVYMVPSDSSDPLDPIFEATIAGEKVSYKESETQKVTFKQEFKDKYLDKLDTYQFTFKYEDDHYVFVDMKKM